MSVCATLQSFFAKNLNNIASAKLATIRTSHKQLFNCNILACFVIQFELLYHNPLITTDMVICTTAIQKIFDIAKQSKEHVNKL